MGRRGPPRTPTSQLKARGSSLVGRNPNEPTPSKGKPRCPAWIEDDEVSKAWHRIADLCDDMGVMTRVDGDALGRYCVMWKMWRDALAFVRENGMSYVTKDKDGKPAGARAWPQVKIANQLATQLLRLEQEFGLTPAARSRISVEAVAPQTERKKDMGKSRFFTVSGA